jgi:recombinational DNA repair protein RecR
MARCRFCGAIKETEICENCGLTEVKKEDVKIVKEDKPKPSKKK